MQKKRDIAAAEQWRGSFNPNRAYTRSVGSPRPASGSVQAKRELQQQNCSGAVSSQVGYAPVLLEAHGQTAVQCRQSESSQQQNSSRAVSNQIRSPVRLEVQGQTAVQRTQRDDLQQQNISRAVSNQIGPPVRFDVQGQTAVQRRQSDSSQQHSCSMAVSNQIGHAPVRLEATTAESRQVRVSNTPHLIRPQRFSTA